MKTKLALIVLFISIILIASVCYIIFQKDNETQTTPTEINTVGANASEANSLEAITNDEISPEYKDFDRTADNMIQSLLDSGRLKKADGNKFVMIASRITNDTTLNIDTNQLMAKIEQKLTNSNLVAFTGDISSGPGSRTLIAPELSIGGKILQRILKMPNNKQIIEYYFQLTLTELQTGLSLWQSEMLVGKKEIKQ